MSRTLTGAAAAAAGAAALALGAPTTAREAARLLRRAMAAATIVEPAAAAGALPGPAASLFDPGPALQEALLALGRLSTGPALAAAVAALGTGLIQTSGLLAPELLRPRWDRLDPVRGLGRLLSPGGAATALLQAGQAVAALTAGAVVLLELAPALAQVPRLGTGGGASALCAAARGAAGPLLAVLAASGAADLLRARWSLARSLRMTRPEVERDLREEEGDPRLRSERRRHHGALLAGGPLPRAVCLVVNPTRLALTLGHRRGSDEAPVVLAKRSGLRAAVLRRRARRAGLPVVRDVSLARALWSLAEVGESIPEELYDAAAVVLARVYALSPWDAG